MCLRKKKTPATFLSIKTASPGGDFSLVSLKTLGNNFNILSGISEVPQS